MAVFVWGIVLILVAAVTRQRGIWQLSIACILGGPGALVFSFGLAYLMDGATGLVLGYVGGFALGGATAWWWGKGRAA